MLDRLAAVLDDLVAYASRFLFILTKDGTTKELELNKAQLYLHQRAEEQLARLGFIRLVVLKGRQQGVSTYVAARLFWRACTNFGKTIWIMTHLDDATTNLFNMVKRFHENAPPEILPRLRVDNAKELYFDALDTRYKVTTAGSKGAGRSSAAQYLHWSEVAFSPNGEKHMAGIGQVIPVAPGTEVFLESTANGMGNVYHTKVMDALRGKGDYELVFIPWWWEPSYRRKLTDDVVFEPEDLEYGETFGLDAEQLNWRRFKILDEFNGDSTLFDQEYPATVAMAFTAGTAKSLIKPMLVERARKRWLAPDTDQQALILGIDPGEYGDDPTAFCLRRGRKVIKEFTVSKEGNAQIAGRAALLIDEYEQKGDPIDGVCIDVTGVGTGVEAFLSDQGYRNIYRVHFGSAPIEPEKYRNRGDECWGRMFEWFKNQDDAPSLPRDCEGLAVELSSRWFTYDSRRRVVMESKESMGKRGVPSPNRADALALTFAVSLKAKNPPRVETLGEKLRRLATRHHR